MTDLSSCNLPGKEISYWNNLCFDTFQVIIGGIFCLTHTVTFYFTGTAQKQASKKNKERKRKKQRNKGRKKQEKEREIRKKIISTVLVETVMLCTRVYPFNCILLCVSHIASIS